MADIVLNLSLSKEKNVTSDKHMTVLRSIKLSKNRGGERSPLFTCDFNPKTHLHILPASQCSYSRPYSVIRDRFCLVRRDWLTVCV